MHGMISRLAHDPGVGKLICAKAFLGPRLLLGLIPRPFPEMGQEPNPPSDIVVCSTPCAHGLIPIPAYALLLDLSADYQKS